MPKNTTRIDLSQTEVKKLSIGDKVTVRLTGKVVELEGERKMEFGPDDEEKFPATMMVEVSKTEIDAPNEFSEMAEDDG